MFKVLTVAREFGSGGGAIAQKIAERLQWPLLDKSLVYAIANQASVDPELVRRYDERVDSWLHRISRASLWHGSFEQVAAVTESDFFDAETMAALSRRLIEEAYEKGPAVIVGRGAQCVLQDRDDVFHVFVYAPLKDRIERARERVAPGSDVEEILRLSDRQRSEFVKFHFGCDWRNPHLYNLMINSSGGEERTTSIILHALNP
jgi:cytidylate kinase